MTNRLRKMLLPIIFVAGKPSANRRRVLEQWIAVSKKTGSCVLVTDSAAELPDISAVRKVAIAKSSKKSAIPDELAEAIKAEALAGNWTRLIIETPHGWLTSNIAAIIESQRKEETDLGNLVSILTIDAVVSGDEEVDSYEVRELEFASRIVLPADRKCSSWISSINPGAENLPLAEASSVPNDTHALGGFRHWMEAGGTAWHRLILGDSDTPQGFIFRSRVPFHPGRWREAVNGPLKEALRVRGIFWIASRMADVGSIDFAAGEGNCGFEGKWWAAQDRSAWPKVPQFEDMIAQRWQEPFGDRVQELAVLDLRQDNDKLLKTIQGALLTESELELVQDTWKSPAEAHAASHNHRHGHDHAHEHHHEHGKNCGCGNH